MSGDKAKLDAQFHDECNHIRAHRGLGRSREVNDFSIEVKNYLKDSPIPTLSYEWYGSLRIF